MSHLLKIILCTGAMNLAGTLFADETTPSPVKETAPKDASAKPDKTSTSAKAAPIIDASPDKNVAMPATFLMFRGSKLKSKPTVAITLSKTEAFKGIPLVLGTKPPALKAIQDKAPTKLESQKAPEAPTNKSSEKAAPDDKNEKTVKPAAPDSEPSTPAIQKQNSADESGQSGNVIDLGDLPINNGDDE